MNTTRSTYDVAVIGAGYVGCSVAYYLVESGLRVVLLDRRGIGGGASSANYGNIQVQDTELAHSLALTCAGWRSWMGLESELGCSVGLQPKGSLLLIETPEQWRLMEARLPVLHSAGIRAELVPAERLTEIEPLLDPRHCLGACYHSSEGQVSPFLLLRGYVRRARERGLDLRVGVELLGFRLRGGRLNGLRTSSGDIEVGAAVLTTGAWTRALGKALGCDWAIPHVHGQAAVTESSRLRILNNLASAAFFENAHEDSKRPSAAALAISQTAEGHFLLGEAATPTASLTSETSAMGMSAVVDVARRHLPALAGVGIMRGWGAPVAFTEDGLPFLGPVSGVTNLVVATAFRSTVIVTPLAGRLVKQMIVGDELELNLSAFSPDRSIGSHREHTRSGAVAQQIIPEDSG